MKDSRKRTKKSQILTKILSKSQRTEIVSSTKARRTPKKRSIVHLYLFRNQLSHWKGKTGQNSKRKRKYGKAQRISLPAQGTAQTIKRWPKLKNKITWKQHQPRTCLPKKVQRMYFYPHQEFHNKTLNDFKDNLGELRTEMEARFNSKDEIINALSKVVKTIQDTLRHPNWSTVNYNIKMLIDKKKISKRLNKNSKLKELPLLNFYILVAVLFETIGEGFRIYYLQMLKPLPIMLMIYYIGSKNSPRDHLMPRFIMIGLCFSLIGDCFLMVNEMSSFITGTLFFMVAHTLYIVAFMMG